jgi:methylation protein EvaC
MSYIPVLNLGMQPRHANGYLTKEKLGTEEMFEMIIGYDPQTTAIRLMEPCKREIMFNDKYAFLSKTSRKMIEHFHQTAEDLRHLAEGGTVVEVGCNDGIMLDAWREMGQKAIGVDPSTNTTALAKDNGHTVIEDFMSMEVAEAILSEGPVSLVYAANVSCHITEFDDYIAAVAKLIGDTGTFVFEDPYFLEVYKKCSYDQFYGEHTWIFTVQFIQKKMAEHGLHLYHVQPIWTHGGSMRYFVSKEGVNEQSPSVEKAIAEEGNIYEKLVDLDIRVRQYKGELLNILEAVKGKKICGFGATSKGVVVTNYCGITPEMVPFITDTTPQKIGKYYPGSHIPIVAQEGMDYSQFDYIINFAWNHFEEIKETRTDFKGKWITHVPHPRIV